MDTHNSNQILKTSLMAETQAEIENAQKDQNPTQYTKEYTTTMISWILRGGVFLSATIILIGFLLLLIHSGGMSGFGISIGIFPHTLGDVWLGLLVLQPQAIIASGLLLLIATPVITVASSMVAFAVERDIRFVVIAFIVLAILITSMLIGKGGG